MTDQARFSWTQPCCEECWRQRNPDRSPRALVPEVREHEVCVFCGRSTMSGIYVRIDPGTAAHPSRVD